MQCKTIPVGSTEIDVFRQSNGSYRLDLAKIARAIDIEIANLLQFLPKENEIETNITVELNGDRQEPAAMSSLWHWLTNDVAIDQFAGGFGFWTC